MSNPFLHEGKLKQERKRSALFPVLGAFTRFPPLLPLPPLTITVRRVDGSHFPMEEALSTLLMLVSMSCGLHCDLHVAHGQCAAHHWLRTSEKGEFLKQKNGRDPKASISLWKLNRVTKNYTCHGRTPRRRIPEALIVWTRRFHEAIMARSNWSSTLRWIGDSSCNSTVKTTRSSLLRFHGTQLAALPPSAWQEKARLTQRHSFFQERTLICYKKESAAWCFTPTVFLTKQICCRWERRKEKTYWIDIIKSFWYFRKKNEIKCWLGRRQWRLVPCRQTLTDKANTPISDTSSALCVDLQLVPLSLVSTVSAFPACLRRLPWVIALSAPPSSQVRWAPLVLDLPSSERGDHLNGHFWEHTFI